MTKIRRWSSGRVVTVLGPTLTAEVVTAAKKWR